jgi:hypothetical protein
MELISYKDGDGKILYKLLVTDSNYGLYSIDAYFLNNIFMLKPEFQVFFNLIDYLKS